MGRTILNSSTAASRQRYHEIVTAVTIKTTIAFVFRPDARREVNYQQEFYIKIKTDNVRKEAV